MSKLADLIDERKELFATIDAWDNGMPISPKFNILTLRITSNYNRKTLPSRTERGLGRGHWHNPLLQRLG